MENFNPKVRAVVAIRNMATGIKNDWKTLEEEGRKIDELLQKGSKIITNSNDKALEKIWIVELEDYIKNLTSLRSVLSTVHSKIQSRDVTNVKSVWDEYERFSGPLKEAVERLKNADSSALPMTEAKELLNIWGEIDSSFARIQELAQGCSLQLGLMEEYAPSEIDEFSDTILRHIPISYSEEAAIQYEKEYMKAYEEIKSEASKKNLWDRLLDGLAGGVQQTPAERVMMQRWVNGEKGDF